MTDPKEQESETPASRHGPQGFVRSALVFYGVMGCAALIWRMASSNETILHPSAMDGGASWGLIPALSIGALVGLAAVGISEVLTRTTSLGNALADLLGRSLAGIGVGDAVLLALASGVAEEMLFRGALQPSVGIIWASLIFGACHFLPRRELMLWSLYAVLMGFAFGWLYEWTGQLIAPIAAHSLVNGINLPRLAHRFGASQTADVSRSERNDDEFR
jgi:membrane protease YdiL (CAAX protease family)